MQLTEQMIITAIRGDRSYLAKKHHQPKPRSGVYGKNIDDAIARLAKKLGTAAKTVSIHVMRLISRRIVKFKGSRLVVSMNKATSMHRKVTTRPSLALIMTEPAAQDNSFGIPPEKSYLLGAWPEYFGSAATAA
jgi:hypothetical protein